MAGRTRSELQAENLVLLRELEEIRNRLDDLLAEEDFQEGEDDDGSGVARLTAAPMPWTH